MKENQSDIEISSKLIQSMKPWDVGHIASSVSK